VSSPDGHRPLSFCLLSTFYPPWSFGGDGIQVRRLAHALADRGHRVTVGFSPGAHRWLGGGRVTPQAEHPGVELIPLDDGLPSLTGVYLSGRPLRSRRRLERLLGRGFDVIHYHNPSLLGAPKLFGVGDGLKLYTVHEQWLLCPSHALLRRGGRVCESAPCWSCELSHRRPPQPWRRTGLLERCLPDLDALITPSETSRSLHARYADLVRIEVIDHFVPEPPEDAGGTGEVTGRPYFLYAGRLEPSKGVENLIEAFRRRRSEDLVIAGEGGQLRRLRRRARDLPHVRLVGQQPPERLGALYRGALAALMATIGHEVQPLVPIEAFSLGTPVIVPRFGAMEELVSSTGAGLSYSGPNELDAALARVARDERLRAELSRRGLEAYRGRFTAGAHLRRYLALIKELTPGGRPEPRREPTAEGQPQASAR
jgi:glycosyltransferase involved in cell wall biosynthesis